MDPPSQEDITRLCRQIQSGLLLNRQLSHICNVNGLKSTGVKAELQNRIVSEIQAAALDANWHRYANICTSVTGELIPAFTGSSIPPHVRPASTYRAAPLPPAPVPLSSIPPPDPMPNNSGPYSLQGPTIPGPVNLSSRLNPLTHSLNFKSSPFYKTCILLGDIKTCEITTTHKQTVSVVLGAKENPQLMRCAEDMKSLRVMLFCSSALSGQQDLVFPHQSELRVNGTDSKANMRGLKNKPGSTRPVDLTPHLHLHQYALNTIDFSYALTNKKFYIAIFLCQITSIEELVAKVTHGKKLTRQSVINEIAKKAQDPDVVATSQVLSLKCPLSFVRLVSPCRSNACTHVQCFDATSYLQLQEQGPQWLCPICNKQATFNQLALDEYVQNILSNTPESADQVIIEPNGQWKLTEPTPDRKSSTECQDDNEDFVIAEVNVVGGRSHSDLNTPSRPVAAIPKKMNIPSENSALTKDSISSKRPIADVIDLTLSSDEDDVPIARPSKRQAFGPNGSSSFEALLNRRSS